MTLSKTKQLTFPFPIIIVILIFFFPFWLKGKIPIPADTIVGMYHPFRDTVKDRYPSGVPFKNFLITDPVRQTYLWKKLAIDYFKEKKWPLWNPYTHSGTPLLANFQTGAFYPLNLLFFIFDFNLAWGIYIAFQPLLGGFFMYYFLKNFKLSSLACLLGSLSFIFGGFSIAWLEWGNIGHTALWLPLILLSIDKSITFSQKKLSKWIIIFLFSLTSSLFAGHLQTFIYLLIFTSIYLFFRIQTNFKKKKLKIYLLFLLLFFIFIALTAVQWIPTLEFIKLSNRFIDQEQLAKSFSGFLPFENLIQLIIPDFFGNPATLNYWGKWNYGEFVSFLGTVPLFFVILALFNLNSQKLRKLILFFFFMIILSLLFSLPTPIGKLSLFLNLPLISSAQPSRLIYLLDFSLACLAAVGFNIFLKNLSKNRIFIRILFPLIFFLLFFAFVWTILLTAPKILPQSLLTQNIIISKRNSILPTIIFILFFFSLIIAWWKKNFARTKNIITILIFVLAIVDLLRFSFKFTPFSQKEWIFPKTKTTDFLIQNNQLYRYMVLDRRIFPPNYSIFYGLKTVEGYDPLYLYSYAKLITQMETGKPQEKPASFNRIINPGNYQSEIINLLGIRYLLTLTDLTNPQLNKVFQEGETKIFENQQATPIISLKEKNEQDQIKILSFSSDEIILETNISHKNQLIYASNFYPGWEAEIDNQKTKITKTEENLISLKLPAKTHTIKLVFNPITFKTGIILSLFGLFMSLTLIVFTAKYSAKGQH